MKIINYLYNNKILFLVLFILFLLSTTFSRAALSSEQFHIFVLHSYSQEYPWTKFQHEGFTKTYYSNTTQTSLISTEYLDTKRKSYNTEYINRFYSYLKYKYFDYKPNLIYVTDDNATQFAINKLVKLFPSTPIIFSGVNNYAIQDQIKSHKITGVFEKKEISPNLKILNLIDENINQIVVVGDDSKTYQAIKVEIKEELKQYPDVEASYIATKHADDLVSLLKQHKEKYLFLTTVGGMLNSKGQPLALNETISLIAKSGNFVMLSMEDSYLQEGVLGGYVTSGRQQGHAAATLALKYQQGIQFDHLPVILKSPNEYIFDHRELEKNNLELPDSIVQSALILNKPLTFYERNRNLIIGVIISLTLFLVLSMAIFLVLVSKKNRQIQNTSRKIKQQSAVLQRVKETLTTAQHIAHLGNWEWNLTSGKVNWSDEIFRILGEHPDKIIPSFENLLTFIPETNREKVQAGIETSINTGTPYEIEHRILRRDGTSRYVRQVGEIHNDQVNQSQVMVGIILDITAIKESELLELERLEKIERYQDALLEWSRVDYENIEEAFERATEISAKTLGTSRVSIWLCDDEHSSIQCKNLYTLENGHEKGLELHRNDFPNYFKALKSGKMMVINDARLDQRTNEFTESYLIPNNIFSMLDSPILYGGQVIGVVCYEHTGTKREWSSHEQEFSAAIANTVSLSLEMNKSRLMEKKLEHQAYHDSLTNLPNRNLFLDRLDQALKVAARDNTMVAVLFMDLDNFKEINDSLGHAAGDQVLTNIASKLQQTLRDLDTIARLGGDEFTLIVSTFNDTQHIHAVVLRIFALLQQPIFIEKHEIYITSSIGISIYPNDGETSETLLRNADAAMYKAKDESRNSFEFYTHDMTERAFERILMVTNLNRALEHQEMVIYYQPQFDMQTQTLVGMEALVRWMHPELGMISPAKFIPVAEETGLIVQLDRWVMQKATKQISDWYKAGLVPGKLALNMATKQLEQEDLMDMIKTTLQTSDCKPEWLAFEITESQIMKDPEKAIAILYEINSSGIEIAVDDFGTGYSSLTYLKRLPVNKLKIDKAFINEIPHDDEDVAIVRAVIALANSLNLSVIAEGVEKQEQADFLLKEGCPHIQGYLYGRPMPNDKMEELLIKQQQNPGPG